MTTTILLISTEHKLYTLTKSIVEKKNILLYWNECLSIDYIRDRSIVVIVDFEHKKGENKEFKKIIEINGRIGKTVPLLAVLENPTSQEIFTVLSMGVFDYVDKDNLTKEYAKKIDDIIQWEWYCKNSEK